LSCRISNLDYYVTGYCISVSHLWLPSSRACAHPADDYAVPDSVKSYLQQFYAHFRDRNTYELASHSDSRFAKISEKHFKDSPWPAPETVAQYVDNGAFCSAASVLCLILALCSPHIVISHFFHPFGPFICP
jgi:hypothetical protein